MKPSRKPDPSKAKTPEQSAVFRAGTDARPVPGFEGWYWVASSGRVFSRHRELVPATTSGGYWLFTLSVKNKPHPFHAHRLVAMTFLGDPTGKLVRHLDGNPANNHVSNLAIGTCAENEADKKRHGRAAFGMRNGFWKYTPEQVAAIRAAKRGAIKPLADSMGMGLSHAWKIRTGELRVAE